MSAPVAWFTGLSGSGKSAIAERVAALLTDQSRRVLILDGDKVRATSSRHLGFSPEDIRENNRLVALLCIESLYEYDIILVPIISPFRDSRAAARRHIGDSFIEVYIKASLKEVINRDPKGHYAAVRAGRLKGFIGIDNQVPYETPQKADLILDTEMHDLEECASVLAELLVRKADLN